MCLACLIPSLFISFIYFYFQTQNSVYEVLSDVNSRQDIMDERIASMEDRMNSIQCSLDVLPDILTRSIVLLIPFQMMLQNFSESEPLLMRNFSSQVPRKAAGDIPTTTTGVFESPRPRSRGRGRATAAAAAAATGTAEDTDDAGSQFEPSLDVLRRPGFVRRQRR